MPPRKETPDARKQRLARALKANLARRKAQAKERRKPEQEPEPPRKE